MMRTFVKCSTPYITSSYLGPIVFTIDFPKGLVSGVNPLPAGAAVVNTPSTFARDFLKEPAKDLKAVSQFLEPTSDFSGVQKVQT